MKIIGLCGGSGSGKGTACSFFNDLGVKSIDTDRLYHSIISTDSECAKELVEAFGTEIKANPGIDRAKLRKVVFSSKESLALLNDITHRHILSEVRSIIKDQMDGIGIIIDAPLLFESGFDKECDVTVAVIADEHVRIERIMKRDGISEKIAKARIASQIPSEELIRRCDYTLRNDTTEQELRQNVEQLYSIIFEK